MSELLTRLKNSLLKENLTLIIKTEKGEYKSGSNGIKPLFEFVCSDNKAIAAADKIVGRAAAFLYVITGVKEVYAEVLSEGAKEIFLKNNIAYEYGTLTKNIINRKGTDICPMEKAVKDAANESEAFKKIKKALEKI